jgi:hypothetical protein
MRHHRITSICILLIFAGCSIATNAQSPSPQTIEVISPAATTQSSDQKLALNHIVGNWEATRFGHQILTARPDGTATIQMCLTPMAAIAYGRHVTLDLRWTLEGSVLTQTIVGGSLANSVRKFISKFGGTQCYHILECQRDYLLASDGKVDNEPIRWTAVLSAE